MLLFFPNLDDERELLGEYKREDAPRPDHSPSAEPAAPVG
jgi:hypothetical protein